MITHETRNKYVESQQNFAFSGVYAAALTPLTASGDPNIDLMASHCRWLLDNGCNGLAILGTTGEANSLSVKERIKIMDGLTEIGIPGKTLMPGTGSCALPDAVELTRAALRNEMSGVLMLPPFYYKIPTDDGLFAAYSEIIQQVGDSSLRICLYHFPQMSGVPISYSLIERLLKEYQGTVVGMKDSSGDSDNMIGAAKRFPGFAVFTGSDELLLPLIDAGGAGCITACANVGASLASKVYQGWKNGSDVRLINETLISIRNAIVKYPLSTALKTLMARHASNDGWLNIRAPLMRLNVSDREALFRGFDAIKFPIPTVI
jgi:4-hydroxy-tetrahydrodipicolinate synthase